MANCVTCAAICERAGQHHVKTDCVSYVPKDYPKPLTNADKIRAMTDEELAAQIIKCVESDFFRLKVMGVRPNNKEEWLDWLKQEVQDG